jgi:hypothetical protein
MFGFSTLTSLRLDMPVFFPGNDRHGIWSSPLLDTIYAPPSGVDAIFGTHPARHQFPGEEDKKTASGNDPGTRTKT